MPDTENFAKHNILKVFASWLNCVNMACVNKASKKTLNRIPRRFSKADSKTIKGILDGLKALFLDQYCC